jgi:hypothetical protein
MLDIPLTGAEMEEDGMDLARRAELSGWVMQRVQEWRRQRDSNFSKKWAEYYRLWRGFWDPMDKNRTSERSRLIAPALQQAVEMTVSEMEEATFGRDMWLDIVDDYEDQQKEDMQALRDLLIEEIEMHGTKAAVSESYLNGALLGTGLGKIMIGRCPNGDFKSWLEPIYPPNFVIDPSSKTIDDALGMAHEINVPKHKVTKRMRDGVYYEVSLGGWNGDTGMFNVNGEAITSDMENADAVFITEYHGLVPERLLDLSKYKKGYDSDKAVGEEGQVEMETEVMVEAIVTIANEGPLLRAVENPYETAEGYPDRAIIGYQHETVPNQFWGRSVSEKGYNPQKALDAELRARIDALGLLTYPVMGIDATRIPRGVDFTIKPGKTILTTGRPSEVLEPIVFGNLNPATFQQSSDLERMVQMGTGAMDTAVSTSENRRNETMGGMSMMQSGFVKRAKRTMQNVERNFLSKMVKKMLNRYCQFDPDRFPQDFKFKVYASMGIMARESEQTMYTQLLQALGPEDPAKPIIIRAIVENSSAGKRGDMLKALDAAAQPNPEQQKMQQEMQRLQMENVQLENDKLQAQVALALAQAEAARATAEYTGVKSSLEDEKIEIMAAQTVISNKKIDNDSKHKDQDRMTSIASGAADREHKGQMEDKKLKAKPKAKPKK